MNDIAMVQAVQKATRKKFRGHTTLKSKVVTHFPENLAAEYRGITNAYMAMMNKTLKEHLPTIRRAITESRTDSRRADDSNDVTLAISNTFLHIKDEFNKKAILFGLARKLENLANLNRKLTVREWRRVVRKTVGLNINEDYYMGEFFRQKINEWTTSNVNLIKSVPRDTINQLQTVIEDGYRSGKTNTAIAKEIQETYKIEHKKAQFWADDQTAKLNCEMTKSVQEDAGVEEYIWSDSGDGRVRRCHSHLNGTRQRWDDPPEMWYMTKSRGRVNTGRRCHPGQDYHCRCVSLPVFNLPTLNLPWEKG